MSVPLYALKELLLKRPSPNTCRKNKERERLGKVKKKYFLKRQTTKKKATRNGEEKGMAAKYQGKLIFTWLKEGEFEAEFSQTVHKRSLGVTGSNFPPANTFIPTLHRCSHPIPNTVSFPRKAAQHDFLGKCRADS